VKVALVDPSLFTIPYDCELAYALDRIGTSVVLYGRRLRAGEALPRPINLINQFYHITERLPKKFRKPLKGIEHAIDMTAFTMRVFVDMPVIVHFQWCPLPLVDDKAIRVLRQRSPVVFTAHDPRPFNGTDHGLMSGGAAELPRLFDAVIVHSNAGREQLIKSGTPSSRIFMIPHGALPVEVSRIREPFSGVDQFKIVFFGKIKPYKGLDMLINALTRLPSHLKQKILLAIVGEPMMKIVDLQEAARAGGIPTIWRLNFVPDDEIDYWLGQSDIFVYPYREIDASGVFMSCLKYGKPVVASRLGMFAAILKDGVHGYLIDQVQSEWNAIQALASAIERIITDRQLADAMGRAVIKLADEIPSWEDIAKSTMEIYRQVWEQWRSGYDRRAPLGCSRSGNDSRTLR
jgi:glycosyltransferase involved in cell wall biosynthesis